MTYLRFVTLNTGSADDMRPPEAGVTHPAALDLARALRDGRAPIADRPGYEISVSTVGSALLCTIWRGAGLPLTTFGVAGRPRGAERLWRMLHEASEGYGLATSPDTIPPVPWCAVRVEPSLLGDIAASWWLAAYEVHVAIAWIERRHRDL